MNILVMGMGYVGVTTALLFAESGHAVTGLDPDARKIASLAEGTLPFYEPGLDALLKKHAGDKSIRFATDPEPAIRESTVIFLCVGTPPNPDGSADLRFIRQAAEWIGAYMQEFKLVVVKSTVPIGTQAKIRRWIRDAQHRPEPVPFDVVSNPEFLREGSAWTDALHPDRIVIGGESEEGIRMLAELYGPMDCPVLVMNPETAEMIKYAANAFLAMKISFINELARLCDKIGVNIADVARGIGLDRRIGGHFLQAGIGFGGSCFPKDVNALLDTARKHQVHLSILEQVMAVNATQTAFFLETVERELRTFRGKTVAVLGLAFKPHTDDTREAPALAVLSHLSDQQAFVRVHDPVARLPSTVASERIVQCATLEEAVHGADAVLLCTEWPDYRAADWQSLKPLIKGNWIFDGRNALDGKELSAMGFRYRGVSNRPRGEEAG